MRAAVTWFDGGAWRDGVVAVAAAGLRLLPDADSVGLPRLDGVVSGAFTDHHVHLQLVDPAPLADSVLCRLIDLGGDPEVLGRAAGVDLRRVASGELRTPGSVEVLFAGAFLTPPGGYPSDRAWAPTGSVREIADADAAERAVVEMKEAGATRIKVASNSTAGPVFSDEMFRTIARIAAQHRLPLVAHAEGRGEAQRVVALGAAALAHAPFSERLTASEIAAQAAAASWASTLAIHTGEAYEIAAYNVRRFHEAGGTVRYGTDMGNGPMPAELSPGEIAALKDAGVDGTDLLESLAPSDPRDPDSRLLFFAGQTPDLPDPLRARPLLSTDLKV